MPTGSRRPTPQACSARPILPPGLQEREEAERLYGAAPQQAPATFEPEEELAQVGGSGRLGDGFRAVMYELPGCRLGVGQRLWHAGCVHA